MGRPCAWEHVCTERQSRNPLSGLANAILNFLVASILTPRISAQKASDGIISGRDHLSIRDSLTLYHTKPSPDRRRIGEDLLSLRTKRSKHGATQTLLKVVRIKVEAQSGWHKMAWNDRGQG
jgi:hypothetical protein